MMSLQRKDLIMRKLDLTPGQGLVDWGLNQCSTNWDESVRDEAVRLWFLAGMFPSVPAGDLLNVVLGTNGYSIAESEGTFTLTTPSSVRGQA